PQEERDARRELEIGEQTRLFSRRRGFDRTVEKIRARKYRGHELEHAGIEAAFLGAADFVERHQPVEIRLRHGATECLRREIRCNALRARALVGWGFGPADVDLLAARAEREPFGRERAFDLYAEPDARHA